MSRKITIWEKEKYFEESLKVKTKKELNAIFVNKPQLQEAVLLILSEGFMYLLPLQNVTEHSMTVGLVLQGLAV